MFQRIVNWFSGQRDISSSCENSDHALPAESSSRLEALASNALSSSSESRHSNENLDSRIDAGRSKSKRSDFKDSNRPRSASLRTAVETDQNHAELHIMSSENSTQWKQEASAPANAQSGQTSLHAEWLKLQTSFISIAKKAFSTFDQELTDQHIMSQLEHTLQQLEATGQRLRDWHNQFEDIINHDSPATLRRATRGSPYSQSLWHAKEASPAAYGDIEDVPDVEYQKQPEVTEPNPAALYYKFASAVRYLSDDLINLGRPPPDIARHSSRDSTDSGSEVLSPQQYAEQHLKLLTEINKARQEAAKYKQQCIEGDIKLNGVSMDGDSDRDADDQDEDLYRSILSERESGPSRIDSIMAVQSLQLPDTLATASPRLSPALRTAEWAAKLESAIDE